MTPQKVVSEYPLGKEKVADREMRKNASESHDDGCVVPRNVTVVNDVHESNAPYPIVVTLDGIVTLVNDVHD